MRACLWSVVRSAHLSAVCTSSVCFAPLFRVGVEGRFHERKACLSRWPCTLRAWSAGAGSLGMETGGAEMLSRPLPGSAPAQGCVSPAGLAPLPGQKPLVLILARTSFCSWLWVQDVSCSGPITCPGKTALRPAHCHSREAAGWARRPIRALPLCPACCLCKESPFSFLVMWPASEEPFQISLACRGARLKVFRLLEKRG